MLLLLVLAFTFGFVGSIPLMGPIAVLVVSRAAERRYGEALRLALGGAVSEGIYAAVAFFGFATFLARHPIILPISRAVTAVVLVALGIHFSRFKAKPASNAAEPQTKSAFFFGFSVTALNPTLLATWSAATAALYAHGFVQMKWWMAFPFGLCAALGISAWFCVFVWLLHRYRQRFHASLLAVIVRAMGVMLVVLGVYSAFTFVRYFWGARGS